MSIHADLGYNWFVAKVRRDVHALLEMLPNTRLPLFQAVKHLHTVGDSHCLFGWPPGTIKHWQGPLLCHNVNRVKLTELNPPLLPGDALCLCFGEIDCRYHIHKQVLKGRKHKPIIDDIVARYFAHVKEQVSQLPD